MLNIAHFCIANLLLVAVGLPATVFIGFLAFLGWVEKREQRKWLDICTHLREQRRRGHLPGGQLEQLSRAMLLADSSTPHTSPGPRFRWRFAALTGLAGAAAILIIHTEMSKESPPTGNSMKATAIVLPPVRTAIGPTPVASPLAKATSILTYDQAGNAPSIVQSAFQPGPTRLWQLSDAAKATDQTPLPFGSARLPSRSAPDPAIPLRISVAMDASELP